jgi:hypothetical protein
MRTIPGLTDWVTYPATRFVDMQRTYDLTLPAGEVTALIASGVAVDPLLKPVGDALRSPASELVGRVVDQRFELYISSRRASGLGLVGTVDEQPAGSRVTTRVAWTGPLRSLPPIFTVMATAAVVAAAWRAASAPSSTDLWMAIVFGVLMGGIHLTSLNTRARMARNHELTALYQRLDTLLAPHVSGLRHPR